MHSFKIRIQHESLVDHIYGGTSASYFDWLLLTYAKLEMPLYTWASRLSDRHAIPFDGSPGDPRVYAEEFAFRRAFTRLGFEHSEPVLMAVPTENEYPAVAAGLRRGMWLNMADYTLAVGMIRTVQYVVGGVRVTKNPALEIAGLSILPGARYALTPLGPEKAITTRFVDTRRQIRSEVRWLDMPSGRRLWSGGVDVSPRRAERLSPRLRADLFERSLDSYGIRPDRFGFRVEVGAQKRLSVGGRAVDAGLRVGYKTSGYVIDAPMKATVLGGISLALPF